MTARRRDVLLILGIGILALILRLIYLHQVKDTPLFLGLGLDSKFYHRWAERIAGGDWVGESPFFMGPVYPYFLAIVYLIRGAADPFAARVVQAVVGSISVVITALLGRELAGRWGGVIAGLMAAVYGPFILFDGEILFPVLQVPLAGLSLLLILRAKKIDTTASWIAAGLTLGVAGIGNASLLLFAPVAAWWVWRRGRAVSWRAPLLLAAGVAAAVLPVTMRNYVVGRDLVLVTSNAGLNFYIGNSDESSGAYIKPAGLDVERDPEGRNIAEAALGRRLKASEISDYWGSRAWQSVEQAPARALKLWIKKLDFFWGDYEVPQIENYLFQSRYSPLLRLPFPSFGSVLGLSVMGVFLMRSRWRKAGPLILFPLVLSLVLSFFFVVGRYRISAVPPLMALAAAGLVALPTEWARSRRRAGVGVLLAVVVFALSMTNPFGVRRDSGFGQCHYRQAVELERTGHREEAERELIASISIDPGYAPSHLNLGGLYGMRGENGKAAREFEEAIRLDPTYPKAYFNLGKLLEETGQLDEAVVYLQRARALDPSWPLPREALAKTDYRRGELAKAEPQFESLERELRGLSSASPEELVRLRQRVLVYLDLLPRRRELAELTPIDRDEGSSWMRLLAADALWADGAADTAASIYRELGESPALPSLRAAAFHQLGVMAYSRRDKDTAGEYFHRAVEIRPDQPEAHFALGNLAFVEGNHEEAVKEFWLEVHYHPDHAPSWLNLGVIYENAMNDFPLAFEAYQRYIELGGSRADEISRRMKALKARLGK